MKFAITLLFLCTAVHAASTTSSTAPLELTESDATKPVARPIKESLAFEIINSRLEARATEVATLFSPGHARNTLGNAIAVQFNSAIDAYKAATSTDVANSVLKTLGVFCIDQELKLFKLQNTRWVNASGDKTYEYDVATLRTILDFAQTEGSALEERTLLGTLKAVSDRLDTRDFVKNLATADAATIFSSVSDHGLVAYAKEVTEHSIEQLIAKLQGLPIY